MADATSPASADKPRSQGEFLRVYVVVMTVMAVLLGWLWWHNDSQADDYRRANDGAKKLFGEGPAGQPLPERPTTIREIAVGVIKYLETRKTAGKSDVPGALIPVKTIQDRANGAHLKTLTTGGEQTQKYPGRRFEEVSVSVTFEQTNLMDFATFLYNLEASSSIFRILDFHWDLKTAEKENPVSQGSAYGHLIGKPTVRIGFRRPIVGSR